VAQLVEHHLAKVGVAGSNPVVRSKKAAGQQLRAAGRIPLTGRRRAVLVPEPQLGSRYVNDDQSECVVLERYRDSAAAMEHASNLGDFSSRPSCRCRRRLVARVVGEGGVDCGTARFRRAPGGVAEWLGRGLQSPAHRFDSGPRLGRSGPGPLIRCPAPGA
jgi:hypothetical protein